MTLSFFLSQSAGFLLQLLPCMELCFLPFEKGSIRLKPRCAQAIVLSFALAASAAFPFALYYLGNAHSTYKYAFANVYMLCAIVLFIAFYIWAVRESALKKCVAVIMVMFYAATQFLLVNLFLPNDETGMNGVVYLRESLLLYAGTAAVLLPVMIWLMRNVLRAYMKEIEPAAMRRSFLTAIIISLCYFAAMFIYSSTFNYEITIYWWVFCPPFLFAAITLVLFYLLLFRDAVLRKRESEYLRLEKVRQIQYRKLKHDMENAARIRHDTRHHYRALYEMAASNHDEAAAAYLTQLIDQTVKKESVHYCLNATVDALLQYYIGWAQDEGIRCDVQADCDRVEVSPLDLSTMIGNTLENAIAACKRAGDDMFICVEIGMVGDAQMAIQVQNTCKGVLMANSDRYDDDFLTAEAFLSFEKTGGYGLRSIAMAAERYNGEAVFRFEPERRVFVSRIRLTAVSVDSALTKRSEKERENVRSDS